MEVVQQKKRPVGRPRGRTPAVNMTLTLPPEQMDVLKRWAAVEGVSVSKALRNLLAAINPALERSVEAFEAAKAEPAKGVQLAAQMLEDGALALKAGQRQLELMR